MVLYSFLLLLLLILVYFHKKFKLTLILYVTLSIFILVYSRFYLNLEWLEWYEKWAIWLKIFPYILLWIILSIITFFYEISKKDDWN